MPNRIEITEKEFREEIRDLCKMFNWKFWFCWTSIHSPRGMTDLILCRPPRLIFAELKTDKKTSKISVEQARWLWMLRKIQGIEVYIWRPRRLEYIVETLR